MCASTVDVLTELAVDVGFLLEILEGKTHAVPSGFARVFVTTGDTMVLRWAASSDDADMGCVKTICELRLSSAGYQFLDFAEAE